MERAGPGAGIPPPAGAHAHHVAECAVAIDGRFVKQPRRTIKQLRELAATLAR